MPSGPFAHVCLLVKDLDKAVEDWTKILGVLDPQQLEQRIVRYDDFEGGEDRMRWATFVTAGGAEIQLMEPGSGHARWAAGWPSTASTCTTSASPPTTRRRRSQRLAEAGVEHDRRGLRGPDDAVAALDLGAAGQRARHAGRGRAALQGRRRSLGGRLGVTTRYGLILPIQRRDAGLDVLLEELGEEVLAAEQAGFDAVFLTEFHQAHGGALVSPLLVLAWLGARTTTIKLGTLVLAGPLHDPARLAEDVLMLDWATRGRVILGLGTAHMPPDFALYGRPREHRGAILDELMDVMEACWSNAPFEYDGRFFQRRGHVTPAPYTQPRPPVWIGAHGPKGLRRAAERADAWVCDPQRDIDTVAKLADEYRSTAASRSCSSARAGSARTPRRSGPRTR